MTNVGSMTHRRRTGLETCRLGAGLAVLLLAACGGSAAPQTAPPAASPKVVASSASAQLSPASSAGAQAQMDQLVAAAKKEGKVVVGSDPDTSFRDKVLPVFQKQYGIPAEMLAATSSSALATKLVQEKAAGAHSADVLLSSSTNVINRLFPAKVYAPLKPALILPDVNNPKLWPNGQLWWTDKQKQYIVRLVRQIRYTYTINPAKIDATTLKSAQDMLNPNLKGKIAAYDPTINGTGQSAADGILNGLGADYLKKLYIGQKLQYGQNDRTMGDWVARGTYPIAIGVADDERARQVAAGFKIEPLQTNGPGMAAAQCGSFLMGLMNNAPHPAAAKLFANWLLTKQGMQTFSDAEGQAVIRLDVSTSKLDPADVPTASYQQLNDECAWDWVSGKRVQLSNQVKTLLSS